jgi:hypothetical protein
MINENKSSYYPEKKTSKQELYSPYNQLACIKKTEQTYDNRTAFTLHKNISRN